MANVTKIANLAKIEKKYIYIYMWSPEYTKATLTTVVLNWVRILWSQPRGQNVRFVVSSFLFVTSWLRSVALSPNFLNFAVSSCFLVVSSLRCFVPSFCFAYLTALKTSCKNSETLRRKNDLSCFKSLLVTGLWDIIQTSLLPSIPRCSSKSWAWSCIATNFDKGWRGITSTRSWTGHF